MHCCKFHNRRTAVAESRSRSFQHSLPLADGRKKRYVLIFVNVGCSSEGTFANAVSTTGFTSPLSTYYFNKGIRLHLSVYEMNNRAAKNYMAHYALVNNNHHTHLLLASVPHSHWACAARQGYRGTSLRTSHSTRAYADTRTQPASRDFSAPPSSQFISSPSPTACFASVYKLILLNWDKGWELTQYEQFRRGFFFSFWRIEMHLIFGLSNYHPADMGTHPSCTLYIYI